MQGDAGGHEGWMLGMMLGREAINGESKGPALVPSTHALNAPLQ